MEIKELNKIVKNEKEVRDFNVKALKNKISNNYTSAKRDIKTIENFEDTIDTLEYVVDLLNKLQERIIKRNR